MKKRYGQLAYYLAEASAATRITDADYLFNLLLTCHTSTIVSNTARNMLHYLQFGGRKPITTQPYRQAKYEICRNGLLGRTNSKGYKPYLEWDRIKATLGVDDSRRADFFKPRLLEKESRYNSGVIKYSPDNEVALCQLDALI